MKTKILIALFASLLIISGCGNTDTTEEVVEEGISDVENALYSLPEAYFDFYFPVGVVENKPKDRAIETKDLDNQYINFRTKDTVSGTVRWSMKLFKADDGNDIVAVSDVLETEEGVMQHLYLVQKNGNEWNDNTRELLDTVMTEAARIPLKERVVDFYEDDVEAVKLRSGMFVISQNENKLTSAITNGGEIELPLYNVVFDGTQFVLEEIEGAQ